MPDDEQKKPEDKHEATAGAAPAEAGEPSAKVEEPAEAPEEPAAEEGDRFNPGAIAARVDTIGDEDELDRIARQEEKKLQERRKGTKGKKGLDAAASRRLAKIGEGKVKRPSAVTEGIAPEGDALLERTAHLTRWIGEHQQTFGALVAIAVLGAGGFLGWQYWQDKRASDASVMLAQGFADQHGHVSTKADDEDETKAPALYPTFKTAAERRDAALAKYREVESKYAGTGAATLARLAEGGLLLDQGDAKGALGAYGDVKASALAQADSQVRGRAIEGSGFADEALAQSDAAARDKHLDDALSAFKQLESIDAKGWKELGMYHEARVQQAKGDKAKAIELLKEVHTAISDPGATHPFAYLELVVDDRLRQLDPTALPPKAAPGAGLGAPGGGAGGKPDMNDPRIQELIRQLQQQAQGGGGAPPPVPAGSAP